MPPCGLLEEVVLASQLLSTYGSKEKMPLGTWKHGIVWNAPHICGESVLLLFINYPI